MYQQPSWLHYLSDTPPDHHLTVWTRPTPPPEYPPNPLTPSSSEDPWHHTTRSRCSRFTCSRPDTSWKYPPVCPAAPSNPDSPSDSSDFHYISPCSPQSQPVTAKCLPKCYPEFLQIGSQNSSKYQSSWQSIRSLWIPSSHTTQYYPQCLRITASFCSATWQSSSQSSIKPLPPWPLLIDLDDLHLQCLLPPLLLYRLCPLLPRLSTPSHWPASNDVISYPSVDHTSSNYESTPYGVNTASSTAAWLWRWRAGRPLRLLQRWDKEDAGWLISIDYSLIFFGSYLHTAPGRCDTVWCTLVLIGYIINKFTCCCDSWTQSWRCVFWTAFWYLACTCSHSNICRISRYLLSSLQFVLFVFQVVTTQWRSVICSMGGTMWSENWAGDISLQSGSAGTCSMTHDTLLSVFYYYQILLLFCWLTWIRLYSGKSVLWRWKWSRALHITPRRLWMRSNCCDV